MSDSVQVSVEYLAKVAEYVRVSQKTLGGLTSEQQRWQQQQRVLREKVASVVESLIDKGYYSADDKQDLISEMTSHPEKLAEVVEQVVQASELPSLGGPATAKRSTEGLDAIAQFALEGPRMSIF